MTTIFTRYYLGYNVYTICPETLKPNTNRVYQIVGISVNLGKTANIEILYELDDGQKASYEWLECAPSAPHTISDLPREDD